jgi:dUTP pyrophosphatase
MKVKIKKLSPDAVIPKYAHAGDSGMDICSIEDVVIRPGSWSTIRTGLAVELPPGTEAQVRPRSGLAARHAISVLNTPGTIDEGYRGEVCVILANHGNEPFAVTVGMRIAQMVICPVLRVEIEEGDTLSETARATGGFGSTGL